MRRILIIKLGALGDVVMATPLVEALLSHHAGDEIHLLTAPLFAPVFHSWPALTVRAQPRHGLRNMLTTIRWLRRQRFNRIYDLQSNDRSAILCALSGARERIGNHPRFPYTHTPAIPWRGESHIFERMCEVLAAADVKVTKKRPLLPATPAERHAVAAWLSAKRIDQRPFALLHAGASAGRPEKRWPYFGELAAHIRAAGFVPVWLGTESERTLNRALMEEGDIDSSGAFSIAELAHLARHAVFAVTNDSGPMHVLSCAAIPVFALFGPSDWQRNHALGQQAQVIAGVEVLAAYRNQRTANCLSEIPVALVWDRIRQHNDIRAYLG